MNKITIESDGHKRVLECGNYIIAAEDREKYASDIYIDNSESGLRLMATIGSSIYKQIGGDLYEETTA